MTLKQMEELLGRALRAQIGIVDAATVIRESPPAATMDRARMKIAEATGELAGMVNVLNEEIAIAEHESRPRHYGDGSLSAPGGIMGDLERKALKMVQGWGRG